MTNNALNYAPTQYSVLSGGASGAINSISPSTSGYVLTSNGLSSQPTFQASSGVSGALIKLHTVSSASTAGIVFNSTYITSTYNVYMVVINQVTVSSSGNLNLQVSTNNGSSYVATGYLSGNVYMGYTSSSFGNQNATTFYQLFTGSSSAVSSGTVWLFNLPLSTGHSIYSDFFVGNNYWEKGYGANLTGSINAIQFYQSGGANFSATATLYGLTQ
jgi:hypothetical protein